VHDKISIANRGEVAIGIFRTRSFRVQDGEAFGQRPARQMVVGDDDVDARLA
jgi:hypothetical protein